MGVKSYIISNYIIHFNRGLNIKDYSEYLKSIRGSISYYDPIEKWLNFINKYLI